MRAPPGDRRSGKKPPPTKRDREQARAFGGTTSTFVPEALVPRRRELGDSHERMAPPPFIKATPQQQRIQGEARASQLSETRAAMATRAPIAPVKERVELQRTSTRAERAAQTPLKAPPKLKQTIAQKTREQGPLGLGEIGSIVRGTSEVAKLAERGVRTFHDLLDDDKPIRFAPPIKGALSERIMEATGEPIGRGLNWVLDHTVAAVVAKGAETAIRSRDGKGGQETAGAPSVVDDVIRNFATGTGQVIAGTPYGVALAIDDPKKVYHETVAQYDSYYWKPIRKGDWAQLRKNLMEAPEQVVFDAWALLSFGAGLAARATALKKTLGATPEELAGVRRGAAIAQAILFQKAPHRIATADGDWHLFGRRPETREMSVETKAPDGRKVTSTVQRMAPQSAAGRLVSDAADRLRPDWRKRDRMRAAERDQIEIHHARSRAELALFAHRIRDYRPSMLDHFAQRLGVSGRDRLGVVSRQIEAGRVDASNALAAALDAVAVGGDLDRAVQVIDNDLRNLTGRLAEDTTNEFVKRRMQDYKNAAIVIRDAIENPTTPAAKQFLKDVEETRRTANEVEETLIQYGILNPDTARRAIDRQWRDAQVLEPNTETSIMRGQLEDAMRARWGDTPETNARIGLALQLLDAQAMSYARRTGLDPVDFYDEAITRVLAADVPAGALQQVANFDRPVPPVEAARNLRAMTNPRTPGSGDVLNGDNPAGISRHGHRVVGRITPEEWVERTIAAVPDPELRDSLARWYEHFEPVFRAHFGPDADAIMRGFAVSQANASPAGGLLNVFRVMDRVERGLPVSNREISTVAESIAMAVKGEPVTQGLAAKLQDFADSLEGKETRTWVGDDPAGGSPTAIDIHAQRDLGRVDPKILATLRDKHGIPVAHLQLEVMEAELRKLEAGGKRRTKKGSGAAVSGARAVELQRQKIADFKRDNADAIKEGKASGLVLDNPRSAAQGEAYNAALREYQAVTDHLNDIEFDGRADWTPAQVQALGWSAIQRYHGVTPEDLQYAIDRNTHRISMEVIRGKGEQFPSVNPRTWREAMALTKSAEDVVRRAVQEEPAAFLRDLDYGPGGWQDEITPSVHLGVVASPESVARIAHRLARVFDQWEVWSTRPGFSGHAAIEIESTAFKSMTKVRKFWEALRANATDAQRSQLSGFAPYSYTLDDGAKVYGMRIVTGHSYGGPADHATVQARYADLLATTVAQFDYDVSAGINRVNVRRHDGQGQLEDGGEAAGAPGESAVDPLAAEVAARFRDYEAEAGAQLAAQWDPNAWYEAMGGGGRPARGGALITESGTTIYVGPGADMTTLGHEMAHAYLPEALAWVNDVDPALAAEIADALRMGRDGVIDVRAQEIFAYAHDVWIGFGRPTATQLRHAWEAFKSEKKAVGLRNVPPQYRADVKRAFDNPSFRAWLSDLNDPLLGVRASDDSFFIPRRLPSTRNPLEALKRGSSRLGKDRLKVKESKGILHESGRDVLGPTSVLTAAERVQRHVETEALHDRIRENYAIEIPRNELGDYDLTQIPEDWEVFNPDGLRGFTRKVEEAEGTDDLYFDQDVDISDILEEHPVDFAQRSHEAAMQVANQVFPGATFNPRGAGRLYMIPGWVKQAYVDDMAKMFTGRSTVRGINYLVDTMKTLHSLQRLRMYMALRYVVVNVGGTEALSVMHQGVFHAFNFVEAAKIARGNPALAARLRAEVGGAMYEAFDIDTSARTVVSAADAVADKVGSIVSRPESFLRETSIIHHMRRAGFRTQDDMIRLLDEVKAGNTEATRVLNQLSRYAEDDVVRFRGLPPSEKEWLRAILFVSGWLVAATRFTLRYPMNHPFWTTALFQVGDEGWEEMRKRLLEYTDNTKSMVVTGGGKAGTRETVSMVDPGTFLPFGVADSSINLLLNVGTFGNLGSERGVDASFNAGFMMIDAMMHSGETAYGKLTPQMALDSFLISGTPLDYLADTWPEGFRWAGHKRTPSTMRVNQSMREYAGEWLAGRMYPSRYYTDEIRERWAKAQPANTRAAARTRQWADEVEALTGNPPDEASYAAKATAHLWQSQWGTERAKLEKDGADEDDMRRAQARLKAKLMREGGFIPPDQSFSGNTAAELLAEVEVYWDATVESMYAATDTQHRIYTKANGG